MKLTRKGLQDSMTPEEFNRRCRHFPSFLPEKEADDLYYKLSECGQWSNQGDKKVLHVTGIPSFLNDVAARIRAEIQKPVNSVQCDLLERAQYMLPRCEPAGMTVPMLLLGQERTFRADDEMPKLGEKDIFKKDILLKHGSLLILEDKIFYWMLPADQDQQFNDKGRFAFWIRLIFRYPKLLSLNQS